LYAGWNLVSFPKMTSQAVGEALSAIAGQVQLVYSSDSGSGGWVRYNPLSPAWTSGLTTFQPGFGYWIKVSSDISWMP
jgi:hypothetical protein